MYLFILLTGLLFRCSIFIMFAVLIVLYCVQLACLCETVTGTYVS